MKQMTGVMVAVAVATCGAFVQAQNAPSLPALTVHAAPTGAQQSASAEPLATSSCAFTFTTGAPAQQNGFLQYCVTVNGNIVSFISPAGNDQIRQGSFGEGYGFCDLSVSPRKSYFDYADFGDSGNWNPPITVSASATMVKIARTTADGAWTLTQTITKVAGPSPYAKVAMSLKNNSGVTKSVFLMRYADVDPSDADSAGDFTETFDSGLFSAWGYENLVSGRPSIGLKITELGEPTPASTLLFFEGLDQNTSGGPDPCNPAGNFAGLTTGVDGSVVMLWGLAIPTHQTTTVTSKYEMF
jgi:hypothetical protein